MAKRKLSKKVLVFYPLSEKEQKKKLAKKNYNKSVTYVGVVSKSHKTGHFTIRVGRSFCVNGDQFCKRVGRANAYDKAIYTPHFIFKVDTLTGIHEIYTEKCKELELKLAKLREPKDIWIVRKIKWFFNITN